MGWRSGTWLSALLWLSCARPALPEAQACERCTVLPNSLVHVALEGFDGPSRPVSAETAAARRREVERRFRETYSHDRHERWFFHAFDDRQLFFVVGRWASVEPTGGRYTAVQRFRVERSATAEQLLGVRETLDRYQSAVAGVRAGMLPADVERVLGRPRRVLQLGPVGAFDWEYPRLQVRFLENRVSRVEERVAMLDPAPFDVAAIRGRLGAAGFVVTTVAAPPDLLAGLGVASVSCLEARRGTSVTTFCVVRCSSEAACSAVYAGSHESYGSWQRGDSVLTQEKCASTPGGPTSVDCGIGRDEAAGSAAQ